MKKTLIVAAVLSTIAGAASAQSSVTLFGVVDIGARYTENENAAGAKTKTKELAHSGLTTSRLGFRGTEDLGGGLKAGFWLETNVNPDNGFGGTTTGANAATNNPGITRFWERRSTVSLEGAFGEFRLGRDFTVTYNTSGAYDPFGGVGLGNFGNVRSNLGAQTDTQIRADNLVSYFTPKTLGGLYAQLQLAPSENRDGAKYYAGRVGFQNAALDVSAAYALTQSTLATEDDYTTAIIGASYDFKVVKPFISYVHNEFEPTGGSKRQQDLFRVGATAPVGSAGLIRAAVSYSDISNDTPGVGNLGALSEGSDSWFYALGYVHNLSKRTALYANVAHIKNDNDSRGAATSVVGGGGSSSGGKSTGFDLGIRHSF